MKPPNLPMRFGGIACVLIVVGLALSYGPFQRVTVLGSMLLIGGSVLLAEVVIVLVYTWWRK